MNRMEQTDTQSADNSLIVINHTILYEINQYYNDIDGSIANVRAVKLEYNQFKIILLIELINKGPLLT